MAPPIIPLGDISYLMPGSPDAAGLMSTSDRVAEDSKLQRLFPFIPLNPVYEGFINNSDDGTYLLQRPYDRPAHDTQVNPVQGFSFHPGGLDEALQRALSSTFVGVDGSLISGSQRHQQPYIPANANNTAASQANDTYLRNCLPISYFN